MYNYKKNPFTYKLRAGKKLKLEKYISMEEGLKKYGVKVENQPIIKINEKTNKKVVTLFSGYLFIEDGYHETRKAIFEFSIPQLYFKGIGENIIKRVCDDKTGTIKEAFSQGQ